MVCCWLSAVSVVMYSEPVPRAVVPVDQGFFTGGDFHKAPPKRLQLFRGCLQPPPQQSTLGTRTGGKLALEG